MRRRAFQRRQRQDLLWYFLGFVAVQLGLGVGVERWWPAVRDPDYNELEQIVRRRQAEAPGRPLVLVLGSSRTQLGLRAERLSGPGREAGPLVINGGISGGGPMMSQVALRRLLHAGIRPRLVFFEIIPMALSAANGAPIEERRSFQGRYSAREAVHLWKYFATHSWLCYNWLRTRVLPCACYHAELRDGLGIDLPPAGRPGAFGRDGYGWVAGPALSPKDSARLTRQTLAEYEAAMAQPALAAGATRACRDAVRLCLDRHIRVVLFVPPESSAFRTRAPAAAAAQMNAVRGLARELDVPVLDARAWVADDGFFDGHHLTPLGAGQFTERFGREALALAPAPAHEAIGPGPRVSLVRSTRASHIK